MRLGCVLCLCFVSICCGTPNFKNCDPKNQNVQSVTVNGVTAVPAVLKKGTDALLTVVFTSKVASKTSTSVCHGVIAGIPVPFPLKNTNGCTEMQPACPIQSGDSYTYSTKLSVLKNYPSLRLVVKWEEKGDAGEDIFCIMIPAVIEG